MPERTRVKGHALPEATGNDVGPRGFIKLVTGILFRDRRTEGFLFGLGWIATWHIRDVPRVRRLRLPMAERTS